MRLLTGATVLLCGVLIFVGGLWLIERETGFFSRALSSIRPADSEGVVGASDPISILDTDREALTEELAELFKQELSKNPTGSLFWLWLAQLRQDQDVERFNATLELSHLTAPREASIMLERAIVGLGAWQVLSQQSHQATIADLLAILPRLNRQPLDRVKAAIAGQDAAARQEIAEAVAARDSSGRHLKRLGL